MAPELFRWRRLLVRLLGAVGDCEQPIAGGVARERAALALDAGEQLLPLVPKPALSRTLGIQHLLNSKILHMPSVRPERRSLAWASVREYTLKAQLRSI